MKQRIVVLSGDFGSGKTTFCRQLIALGREHGLSVAGILSPARFIDGQKTGIDVESVSSGKRHPLAEAIHAGEPAQEDGDGPATQGWQFHRRALTWSSTVLRLAAPCDVLVIDEIGPLELLRHEGWTAALDVLRAGQYGLAVVVVRPSLVADFTRLFPDAVVGTITLTQSNKEALPRQILDLIG